MRGQRLTRLIVAALLAPFLASSLAGCATGKNVMTVTDDRFMPQATINGTAFGDSSNPQITSADWSLRSFIDKKSGAVTHQIYADLFYREDRSTWHDYFLAYDDWQNKLKTYTIGRDRETSCNVCNKEETIGIDVADKDLRAHMDSGYAVKLIARDGLSSVLTLPADYIRAQYAAIDGYGENGAVGAFTAVGVEKAKAAEAEAGIDTAPVVSEPPAPGQPKLGLHPANITSAIWSRVGLDSAGMKGGAVVMQVDAGSPADAAGVEIGDIVVAYNGQPVATVNDLSILLHAAKPGGAFTLSVWRGKQEMALTGTYSPAENP